MQAAPFKWCPLTADNQPLPWNDEVWHYHIGSRNLLEAFSQQSTNSYGAIDWVELKTWKVTHIPRWRGTKQLQTSYDISLPSLGRAGEEGLPRDPASMVASGHKSVVNHLTGNTHSLQIPHPLGENTDTLEAVFTDHYEEYAFLVGCGLSRNSCWLPGCGLSRNSCWLPWFQTSSDSLPQEMGKRAFLGILRAW